MLLVVVSAVFFGLECHVEYQTYVVNFSAEALRVSDNELLSAYFEGELMDAERITESLGGQFHTEYFVIDLNEDEYEDYLVRLEGAGYSGSGGDSVYILVGEEEGLRTVFAGTIRFSSDDVKYGPFVVLKEKTKDMHDIVFTAYDKVWKYNELADCYE
ncbi:MAG: hypothetical protein IJZ82_10685 [Lachnospiraceae bacterium]|nr:hypothetical protein [Lachnospiraceae bacterium]